MESESPYFHIFIKNLWVLFILVGVLNGFIWWWKGRNLEAGLRKRHKQLVLHFIAWVTFPFLVMGLTITFGGVLSVGEYIVHPRNPFVLAWYVIVVCVNGAGAIWLLRGGADEMVRMPDLVAIRLGFRAVSMPKGGWYIAAVMMLVFPPLWVASVLLFMPPLPAGP